MKQTPLVIEHLTKKYGNMIAVDDLSLTIEEGEIFGLLGPNGAGKTTIISTIMTLQRATSGTIRVFGFDTEKEPSRAKSLIGYVPQELVHHGFFSVKEILHYHANYFGIKRDESKITDLLEKLDLYSHRNKLVNQLSGGMKRRLMIAKSLLHEPQLLLLDEPTAGVDLELRHRLWNFIYELKEKNISILLTTHYLEEAEELCDRIGILQKGHLQKTGTVNVLLHEHSLKRVSLTLKSSIPSFSHPLLELIDENCLHFRIPPIMAIQELIKEVAIPYEEILDVEIQPGTLEDVMQNILNQREQS